MRHSAKIHADLLRVTGKMGELEAKGNLTQAEKKELAELTKQAAALHDELADAYDAEADATAGTLPDGESAESMALAARANAEGGIGAIVDHLIAGTQPDGAIAELQQAHGVPGSSVPLTLLRPQNAVTPGTQVGIDERPVVQPVFAMGDLAFFGIGMDSVPAGDAAYPILTTRPNVGGPHADSAEVGETTGAFVVKTLQPLRSQCSFFYRRSDSVRFAGMSEALRSALVEAISENEDRLFIAELSKAANAGGLGPATNLAGAQATFANYQALAAGRVEGRHAKTKMDVRALVGSVTYGHADGQYQANGDDSALAVLERTSGGVRVSPHIGAVANKKQNAFVRVGMERDFACAMWNNVHLIYDEITRSKTGEIQLTAVTLSNRALLRAEGFARLDVQVQA